MAAAIPPAYRIETPRLVLRCWDPGDADALHVAIQESLPELLPFMPWARHEPMPPEARRSFLRECRGRFDLDDDFVYGVFDRAEARVLGGTGLHTRLGPEAREIGYWVRSSHSGAGVATELTAALARVAFEVEDLDRVEVRCDPANPASARVAEKLGFVHEATLRRRVRGVDGELRDSMIWGLHRADFAGSAAAAASAEVRAFDAAGLPLLG